MKGLAISLLVVLAMAQFMAEPSSAITCSQVDNMLAPCISYLTKGGAPTSQCCGGVRNLKSATPAKPDRQAACNCIKKTAARYGTIRDDAAAALPQKCGVQTNIPISRNMDCSRVR